MLFRSVSCTVQGFLDRRKPNPNEAAIFTGQGMPNKVEFIGTFRLVLNNGHLFDLKDTFYIPTFHRNLISVSCIHKSVDYSLSMMNNKFSLFYKSEFVGSTVPENGLYRLLINDSPGENYLSMHGNVGSKRGISREMSAMLWHKRLGHISKERMLRLIREGILENLDFSDFSTCVDCIKGKQINTSIKKNAKRSDGTLELIHTDICGPFPACITGHKYFITFTDDYSRYGYLYMLKAKSEALERSEERRVGKECLL